jgi:Fe2+ transport system protein B
MAEQEVIKHTKKVISEFNDSNHSFWHKAREFFTEILIIVFAISLSIWFHNWSEHNKEQAQVKTFLLGLRNDVSADISDAKEIKIFFHNSDSTYRYLSSLDRIEFGRICS